MNLTTLPARSHPRTAWVLRLFGDVRPDEALTVVLLTFNLFLVMTAYYVLKVAREPLILLGGGAEVKSYAAVGQAVLLVGVANLYGWLANRMGRLVLIGAVTLFFAANLAVFALFAARGDGGAMLIGVSFFLWLGVFNLVTVTQFWSFAADIYGEEQGKRLFPVVGIGSSVGAVGGAALANRLMHRGSPSVLMIVAAVVLLAALALTIVVHHRTDVDHGATHRKDDPVGDGNAFAMVLRDRYLLLLAGLIFVLNISTKTGDYVLDRMLIARAHEQAFAPGGIAAAAYIGQFKAQFFEWINVLEIVLQSFAVSRVIKYGGIRASLVLVPLVSLGGYASAFAAPLIGVLFATRVAESTLDYSLSNTVRQSLWLVTAREAKYKAKQVVDSFVWRAGDTTSAAIVWIGVHVGLSARGFIGVNVVVALVWVAITIVAGKEYLKRTADRVPKVAQGFAARELHVRGQE